MLNDLQKSVHEKIVEGMARSVRVYPRNITFGLVFYIVFVTVVRVYLSPRFISGLDIRIMQMHGENPAAAYVYYAAPLVILVLALLTKFGAFSLVFLQSYSVLCIWVHCWHLLKVFVTSIPFLHTDGNTSNLEWDLVITVAVTAILVVVMSAIFKWSYDLYRARVSGKLDNYAAQYIAAVVVTMSMISAPLFTTSLVEEFFVALNERMNTYPTDSFVLTMAASKDGRFLAVGCARGLSLWDTKNMRCISRDMSIAPSVLRFSDSGRYLAAGGDGLVYENGSLEDQIDYDERTDSLASFSAMQTDKGASDLALYDLDRMERVEIGGFYEIGPGYRNTIYDISFSENESELLVASSASTIGGFTDADLDVYFTKLDIAHPGWKRTVKIADIPNLEAAQSLRFSPGGGELYYMEALRPGDGTRVARIISIDTDTGSKSVVYRDENSEPMIGVAGNFWVAWDTRSIPGKIFLLREKRESSDIGGETTNVALADQFSELDLETKHARDLFSLPLPAQAFIPSNKIIRMAISPDGKKAALLGYPGGYSNRRKNDSLIIHIVSLETGKQIKEIRRWRLEHDSLFWRVTWLDDSSLAISYRVLPMFCTINVPD